ncbi:MAG: PAS domain S-box protein [Nitrospirae bacterium]|nr:PAS domain S-box protein [Nitrospirota bacterium]
MVFLLLAGILISSGFLTQVMNKRGTAVLLSFEQDRSSLLADDIARELRQAMLLDKKPSVIKTLVTSHTVNSDVKTALFRGDGTLYAGETDHEVPEEIYSNVRNMSVRSKGRLIYYMPLLNEEACRQCHKQDNKILGIVMVDISSGKVSAAISQIRSSMIFFTVSLAVLGSLVLVLVLKKMVFSPLAVLHEAAEKVGSGELQHRVALRNRDEFGTVASAFNQMAESVERSHATLEDAVRQRTEDLKSALSRVRESEATLREAQHIARMGSWEYDADTERFYWSEETYRIFGKAKNEPVTLASFLESVHTDDRGPLFISIENAISTSRTEWRYDYRIVLPSGDIRSLSAEGRAVVDESGRIVKRIGTVQDITERKMTEAALHTLIQEVAGKTDEEFFDTLVEKLARTLNADHAFVGELSPDLSRVRTIALFERGTLVDNMEYTLAGTPCENVVGKALCIYPRNVQELFPHDHLLVTMGATSYIGIPLNTSKGKPIGLMAVVDSRPIENVKFFEFIFNIFSISAASELQRMRTARALRKQKEFSDAIFDSTTSGIMVLDKKGWILKINRAGASLLERCVEEIEGRTITELCPETLPFLTIDNQLGHEILLAGAERNSIPIGYSNSLLRDALGNEEGVIVLFRDLSEVKKLQAELKKKDHFETMGKVVSGVAHEVRNPLFGITSIGQILEREIEAPQHRALVSAMLKETKRMKNLIEELLLYTRPSRLDIRRIDLNLLLLELEHHVKGKRTNITVSIDAPLPATISADRDKITQVLLNLFSNAIEAANTNVLIKAMTFGEHTSIVVQDAGPGISAANQEKIFEPFFTTKKGGTGLGLPICRKLVEDHDGTLDIQSTGGAGTTVTLQLKS